MRRLLFALTAVALPLALPAQGWVIPRPCPLPVPPPCVPERPCPLPRPRPCPPLRGAAVVRTASDVRVELADGVLRYEVEETFENRGGGLGEADYLFPLPKGAAFQDLKLSINGELVAGETMSAEQARGIYEEIVRRRRDPALVEWMGYGLLRARIFPIAPGERKRVVVRFQSVAQREGDALRVDYFRGTSGERRGARLLPVDDVRDRDDFGEDDEVPARGHGRMRESSFTFTYSDDPRYGRPYSPTHSLRVRESRGRKTVEVRGDAAEVTLLLPVRRPLEAAVTVLAHAPSREDGFALITLAPPARRARATPRDVTFVVDVSGSMSGRKIDQARAAGKQLLSTLSPRDRFRLIDFSTDVRSFRDDFVEATDENLAAARRYLDALDAEGSTNISGALEEALRAPHEGGRMPVVLFVTDGEPTVGERSPEAIAETASRLRGRARVFTFGVGADVNAPLVEELALEGRGTAQFVRPDESVERAVSLVASRLTSPVATDVVVRAEGVRLLKMLPSGPVDVFAGQDLVLLARYDGSGRARLRFEGRTADGPVSWTSTADFPERERGNAFVARLWATQRVGYLAAEKRKHGGSEEVDEEIRRLGERFGIPTEFSSYLVQEPDAVAFRDLSASTSRTSRRGRAASPASTRRSEVAVTGAGEVFDAAKQSAEQRAATSLDAADSATPVPADGAAGVTRRVGERIFTRRVDGAWVDARHDDSRRVVRVRAFSDAYFALLDLLPELRPALALGDRVVVAGRVAEVEVTPNGAERLSRRELDALRGDW